MNKSAQDLIIDLDNDNDIKPLRKKSVSERGIPIEAIGEMTGKEVEAIERKLRKGQL